MSKYEPIKGKRGAVCRNTSRVNSQDYFLTVEALGLIINKIDAEQPGFAEKVWSSIANYDVNKEYVFIQGTKGATFTVEILKHKSLEEELLEANNIDFLSVIKFRAIVACFLSDLLGPDDIMEVFSLSAKELDLVTPLLLDISTEFGLYYK
jgi:hypothetical protein